MSSLDLDPGSSASGPPRAEIDIVLRLLDHQIIGPDGALLGNVDDLTLEHDSGGAPLITGILIGPGALGPRHPDALGQWTTAVWRRLHPSSDPQPLFVPMTEVRDIGSAVTVTEAAQELIQNHEGFELWLREFVIARIPGARVAEDREQPPTLRSRRPSPELPPRPSGSPHTVTSLLRMEAVDAAGTVRGPLQELTARSRRPEGTPVGPLELRTVIFGRHRLGGQLGYRTQAEQGPWLVARLLKWWHRGDGEVPWSDVGGIDWQAGRVTLRTSGPWPHPHDRG